MAVLWVFKEVWVWWKWGRRWVDAVVMVVVVAAVVVVVVGKDGVVV